LFITCNLLWTLLTRLYWSFIVSQIQELFTIQSSCLFWHMLWRTNCYCDVIGTSFSNRECQSNAVCFKSSAQLLACKASVLHVLAVHVRTGCDWLHIVYRCSCMGAGICHGFVDSKSTITFLEETKLDMHYHWNSIFWNSILTLRVRLRWHFIINP